MGQPSWRQIVPSKPDEYFAVPDRAGRAWTLALDFVEPGKLLKVEVEAGATWIPAGMSSCGPDGEATATKPTGLPVTRAARGALIGRIGGSTADQEAGDDMFVFSVGRVCVLQVPEKKHGSLFLGVNDPAVTAQQVEGQLSVRVFEAL